MNKHIEKIELLVLKGVRRIYRRYNKLWSHHHISIKDQNVSDCVYEALMGDAPFALARLGSTEFKAVISQEISERSVFFRYKCFLMGWIPSIRNISEIEKDALRQVYFNAGIFPNSTEILPKFYREMRNALNSMDVLAVWLDEDLLSSRHHAQTCAAECIEPYDYAQPWSRALAGKKVLVIHPFAETIRSQYERKEKLWQDPNVLPDFELKTLKAVQTIAGESSQFEDWSAALEYMKRQIDTIDFEVAIIGCGAYGFPLAAYCKQIGKKAIHLAGATQILFGIKGKRWDDMPAVNKFYNEYWVRPLPDETPKQAKKVEDGCYW